MSSGFSTMAWRRRRAVRTENDRQALALAGRGRGWIARLLELAKVCGVSEL